MLRHDHLSIGIRNTWYTRDTGSSWLRGRSYHSRIAIRISRIDVDTLSKSAWTNRSRWCKRSLNRRLHHCCWWSLLIERRHWHWNRRRRNDGASLSSLIRGFRSHRRGNTRLRQRRSACTGNNWSLLVLLDRLLMPLLESLHLLLLLVAAVNRFSNRPTNWTPNILTTMVVTQHIPRTNTMRY